MARYETVFILTPVLSEEQMKEAVIKYVEFLKELGGEMLHHTTWGLRKLAYPIQKKTTGFYEIFEYEATGEVLDKLEVAFKRDEKTLRFLTVKLDKNAIAYNDAKRAGKTFAAPVAS